ncbi:MAG: aminodeoxychorismate synthase component I, partial [Mesorhizobium sp.]
PAGRRAPLFCLGVFDAPVEETVAPGDLPASNGPIFDAKAAWSSDDYAKRFARLHDHIRKGDCYQGNLTFPV